MAPTALTEGSTEHGNTNMYNRTVPSTQVPYLDLTGLPSTQTATVTTTGDLSDHNVTHYNDTERTFGQLGQTTDLFSSQRTLVQNGYVYEKFAFNETLMEDTVSSQYNHGLNVHPEQNATFVMDDYKNEGDGGEESAWYTDYYDDRSVYDYYDEGSGGSEENYDQAKNSRGDYDTYNIDKAWPRRLEPMDGEALQDLDHKGLTHQGELHWLAGAHSFWRENSTSLLVICTWLGVLLMLLLTATLFYRYRQQVSGCLSSRRLSLPRRRTEPVKEEDHQLLVTDQLQVTDELC